MPLAHILAPQLAKKIAEIESAIGPARGGYLQTVGYEKTPYDPRGLMNKPEPEAFDPKTPGGAATNMLGALQRSNDPNQQAFAKGALLGMDDKFLKGFKMLPPAAAPAPVQAEPRDKKGRVVLKVAPGEAIGVAEDGQAVDARGRKLGYLNQPALVTPQGELPMRTGERRPGDIIMGQKPGTLEQTDGFTVNSLEQKYGKHYRESDVDSFGVPNMKFPEGYFKGKSKAEREDIQNGVKALIALKQGVRT